MDFLSAVSRRKRPISRVPLIPVGTVFSSNAVPHRGMRGSSELLRTSVFAVAAESAMHKAMHEIPDNVGFSRRQPWTPLRLLTLFVPKD